jgi:hypothetical protein
MDSPPEWSVDEAMTKLDAGNGGVAKGALKLGCRGSERIWPEKAEGRREKTRRFTSSTLSCLGGWGLSSWTMLDARGAYAPFRLPWRHSFTEVPRMQQPVPSS